MRVYIPTGHAVHLWFCVVMLFSGGTLEENLGMCSPPACKVYLAKPQETQLALKDVYFVALNFRKLSLI